jgi:hypothetical protein
MCSGAPCSRSSIWLRIRDDRYDFPCSTRRDRGPGGLDCKPPLALVQEPAVLLHAVTTRRLFPRSDPFCDNPISLITNTLTQAVRISVTTPQATIIAATISIADTRVSPPVIQPACVGIAGDARNIPLLWRATVLPTEWPAD